MGQGKSDIWEKVKKIKWWIIGAGGIIVLAIVLRITLNPTIHYNKGIKLFDSGEFSASAEQFLAAGNYKDALSKAKVATAAQNYTDGVAEFESGNYMEAVECFGNAGNYEDAAARVVEAQYGVHYKNGEDAFACGNYAVAISEFGEAKTFKDAKDQVLASTYALADKSEKIERYEDAIEGFNSLGSYSDAKERVFAIGLSRLAAKDYTLAKKAFETGSTDKSEDYYNYTQGKSLFEENKYSSAKSYFAKCNVENAEELCTACDYLIAEEHYQDGELNTAKKLFESLPKDYSYNNGVKVSTRLENLEKYKSFVALCGTWAPTDNHIESRNIYKRTGSWDSWYIDDIVSDQSITIKCIINNGASVTVKGEVEFYRFTDYSSLKEYCNATKTTKTFTIQNITKIPAAFAIDSNTTLNFANNTFSISYYVKDEYSVSFYNTYSSRVTFGKLKSGL